MLSALGYSAWYVATTACALNKAMGWKISPKNLGLPPRRKSDIWRCRAEPKPVYVDIEQQTVARASGMRRMSVTKFRGCDCVRNADNQVIGIHVKEKGGKVVREAGPMKHGTTVIAFVEDPDGYKIEFIQKKSGSDSVQYSS